MSAKLTDMAILTRISGHQWTGKHKDKERSEMVAVQANAESDAVDCIVNLISAAELQPITAARSRVDRTFKNLTLPWGERGVRILASEMFFDFRDKLKKPIAAYNDAVDAFAVRYPDLVKEAPKRLGSLAALDKLPDPSHIKHLFRLEQNITPIPNMADFRCDWADDEAEDIRKQAVATYEASLTKAVQDIWLRLSDLIGKVAETMGQADKKFRDSLFSNLKEFCELVPKFNITNDKDLEQIRMDVMAKLVELDPDDLREIPNNRKKAAKDAADLMNKISQYIK